MADSTTNILQIVAGINADARVNENFDAGSPAMVYGRNAQLTTGLTWAYYGGRVFGASISNGTVALTASNTNYVVASRLTGVVSVSTSTTNWNDSAYARLYLIVAGSSSITSYQDHRDLWSSNGSASGGAAVTTESGTSRDIASTDAGKYIRFTNSSAKTATFRPSATHALPTDSEYHLRNAGTGDLTITPGSGVTLNAPAGGTLVLSNKMTVTVKKVGTDEYDVIGQTVPL